MELLSLEIDTFRNLAALSLSPHSEFTFIQGDNGQGKTNLMEAIYLLFNLRPVRTGNDLKPLVQRGADYFALKGRIADERGERELFFSFSKGKKRLLMDGERVTPKRFLEHAPVQFFSPDQASLLVESPEVRRRVLDREVFHLRPDYFDTISSFKGALKRRNSILKMEPDPQLLASLDFTFAPLAFTVSQKRAQVVELLDPVFQKVWSELKPHAAPLTVQFKANLGGAQSPEELRALLKEGQARDFARGSSSLGPQREDVEFLVDGRPSKHFISHGERKTAALAFTLAFTLLLMEKTKRKPLILLDDLAAELDMETRELVLSLLHRISVQLLLTSIQFPWESPIKGDYYTIKGGNPQCCFESSLREIQEFILPQR